MKICSHTLVKNGMPFIGLVISQVLPYMNRCLITISTKSNDGTLDEIEELKKKHPNKIYIDYESVSKPGELTQERQKMLEATAEDWVLFLDDDDYWPRKTLRSILNMLDEDVDGYAVNPFQMVGRNHYDESWRYKYFTKFFKNQPGVHYEKPWPLDRIYKDDEWLYWRKNLRVKRIPHRFFHLSNAKDHSFRNEAWAENFRPSIGKIEEVPSIYKKDLERIYEYS